MDLNREQRIAVEAPIGTVSVMAGAGSGKTRVLVERVVHLVDKHQISAYNILLLTFTRKATLEMRERLQERLGNEARKLTVSTLHAFCLSLLYRFGDALGWRPESMTVFSEDESRQMLEWTLEDLGYWKDGKSVKKGVTKTAIADAFLRLGSTGKYPDPIKEAVLHKIVQTFYNNCREANALTYSFILVEARKLFKDPVAGKLIREQYQHVILDEMQDTNPLQFEILNQLIPKSRFMVGDLRQSIFSFAGGDMETASAEHKSSEHKCNLGFNYRSGRLIVAAGNTVMRDWARTIPARDCPGEIIVQPSDSSNIALIVRTLLERYSLDDIAILCRIHRPLGKSVRALRDAGFPVYYPHEKALASAHPHTRVIHAYLSLMINPWDMFAFRTIAAYLELPASGIQLVRTEAVKTMKPVADVWNQDLATFDDMPLSVPWKKMDARIAEQVLLDLTRFGYEHTGTSEKNAEAIRNYLKWYSVKDIQAGLEAAPKGYIQSLSIHQAKGLEWRCVILIGASEGILPGGRATSADALEEERRVAYVAVTRAKDTLVLSPRPDGEPSRFMMGIG